jgi:broad specificity phosphatase PhoE
LHLDTCPVRPGEELNLPSLADWLRGRIAGAERGIALEQFPSGHDSLSELGERQARLVGEHFISQGIRFAAAYAGALTRQQQTAEQIRAAHSDTGVGFPTVRVDSGWDEFDLGRIYREIAPVLAAEDPEFLHEYDEMREHFALAKGRTGREFIANGCLAIQKW